MERLRNEIVELNNATNLLFHDLGEEITLFHDFFETVLERKKTFDQVLHFLEEGGTLSFKNFKEKLIELYEKNDDLISTLRDILRLDMRTIRILRFLFNVERKLGSEIESPKLNNLLMKSTKELAIYFKHLDEKLEYLKKTFESENKKFLTLGKDLDKKFTSKKLNDEHIHLYQLFSIERKELTEIKDIIYQIRSEIRVLLRVEKGEKKELVEEKEDVHRIVIEDIINPNSTSFKQFYNELYKNSFDEDERDTIKKMKSYMNKSFQRWHMSIKRVYGSKKELYNRGLVQGRNHLLVAKIRDNVVGGMMSEFVGLRTHQISFGIIWYFCTHPHYEKLGLTILKRLHDFFLS